MPVASAVKASLASAHFCLARQQHQALPSSRCSWDTIANNSSWNTTSDGQFHDSWNCSSLVVITFPGLGALVISEVMTAFSTASSAALALLTAPGKISPLRRKSWRPNRMSHSFWPPSFSSQLFSSLSRPLLGQLPAVLPVSSSVPLSAPALSIGKPCCWLWP